MRLTRARITLRRRTGGTDEGWHLKLPRPDGAREELHLPLDEGTAVPAQLAELVRPQLGDGELSAVVRLKTVRRSHDLVDADGTVLATLADDQVAGELAGDVLHLDGWRELEVELAPGAPPELLGTLAHALIAAGARPAYWPSKLRRVIAPRLPDKPPAPGRRATAGEVVLAYLRAQVAAIREHDQRVRRDAGDAVHQLRVAIRRTRSALTVFRRVLDRDATRALSAELKWAAGELSPARDTEVLYEHLSGQLTHLPEAAVVANAPARLRSRFEQRTAEARERVRTALRSGRYAALFESLDRLLAEPPLTERANAPARAELEQALKRAHGRLADHVARLTELAPGPELDAGLHEVRKKAKRARYAAEVVVPVAGKRLQRWQREVKALTKVLGEHHDSVVAREALRDLAGDEGAFTFGVLYQRELDCGHRLHERFSRLWKGLGAP
ncbi:CHAD domain-containing protein [Amycolatopsis sacchari]|uniref:CYTH and CHAD domain-containing protein n=1 Tax=Amycolatopsis sacchari TaxID=115433 RepID=UPI001FEA0CB0